MVITPVICVSVIFLQCVQTIVGLKQLTNNAICIYADKIGAACFKRSMIGRSWQNLLYLVLMAKMLLKGTTVLFGIKAPRINASANPPEK